MKPILVISPLYHVTPAVNLWRQWREFKKKIAVSCAFAIVECITTSKNWHSLPLLVFFLLTQKKAVVYPFGFLHVSMIQRKKKSSMKYLLTQLKTKWQISRHNLSLVSVQCLYYAIIFSERLISNTMHLFWSAFFCTQTEYGEILCISPSSVRIRENMDHTE